MRFVATGALFGALALTAGCTTLGTNVSGAFKCEAPDGICAPSIAIDDQALSQITDADAGELLSPAGPYKVDDGDGGRARLANASAVRGPDNESFKLNVVFPAYTDVAGNTHARRAVTADVALPGRTASSVELANRSRGRGMAQGLLAAAQSAPALITMKVAEAPASLAAAEAAAPVAGAAEISKVGAVEKIKADVSARLTTRARRQAASFPSPE